MKFVPLLGLLIIERREAHVSPPPAGPPSTGTYK